MAASLPSCFAQNGAGNWQAKTASGALIKNTWVKDDAAVSGSGLYLLDADGNLVVSPLVQDELGYFYSFETNPEGNYGMLRTLDGTYDDVALQFEISSESGVFGTIKNPEGAAAMAAKFPVKKVNLSKTAYVTTTEIANFAQPSYELSEGTTAAQAIAKLLSEGNNYSDLKFTAKENVVYIDCYTADTWKDLNDAVSELLLEMTWGTDDCRAMYRELAKNAKNMYGEDVVFCMRGYKNGKMLYMVTYDETKNNETKTTGSGNPLLDRRSTNSPFKKN